MNRRTRPLTDQQWAQVLREAGIPGPRPGRARRLVRRLVSRWVRRP